MPLISVPFRGYESIYEDILFAFTRARDSFGKSVLSIAPSGLRFTRMEHIESTSRKETRFPSKYSTNLASRRFTLLPHPHRPFASLKGIRKDFSTTVVDEIDRTSLESIFIGKNSTIFFFSTVYGLLGQRIENSVALYTHYVLIKYSYCFTNLPF